MYCLKRVNLELTVCDYDRIGTSDPIGRVTLGYNRKGAEIKHWKEMVENPRRPVIHWHVLQVRATTRHTNFSFFLSPPLTTTTPDIKSHDLLLPACRRKTKLLPGKKNPEMTWDNLLL